MKRIGWLILSVWAGLGGCSFDVDSTTEPLAGDYQLFTDYEGYSSVQYDGGWWERPVLLASTPVDSVGVVGPYLAVCDGETAPQHYYLLPLAVQNGQQALAKQVGPLSVSAFRRCAKQVVGDSVPRLRPAPR